MLVGVFVNMILYGVCTSPFPFPTCRKPADTWSCQILIVQVLAPVSDLLPLAHTTLHFTADLYLLSDLQEVRASDYCIPRTILSAHFRVVMHVGSSIS